MTKQNNNSFVIGAKLLYTLTTGMYTNSFIIYREFIQNSADAIDDATNRLKIMESKDASIQIKIDKSKRQIIVEDNATGIPKSQVYQTLGSIGNSQKDASEQKGFIGIGRLAALGYCRRLIFETKYYDENVKSTVVFDAEKLRSLITNKTNTEILPVLENSVSFSSESCSQKQGHYFKVTMEDILSSHDKLLDEEQVVQYLRQVAPVKFSNIDFEICADKIENFISDNNLSKQYYTYKILVNGQEITKGYSELLPKNDKIKDVRCSLLKIVKNGQERTIGWYWFGIRQNNVGVLTKSYLLRYIRLRKGNIQIGEADCLDRLWKEELNDERANHSCIGEVHILVPELIPNGRRDYFEENEVCRDFEESLKKTIIPETGNIYRESSNIRILVKDCSEALQSEKEIVEKQKLEGFSEENLANVPEVRKARDEVKKQRSKLEKKRKDLEVAEDNKEVSRILCDYFQNHTNKLSDQNTGIEKFVNIIPSSTLVESNVPSNVLHEVVELRIPSFTQNEQRILKIVQEVLNKKLVTKQATAIYEEISRRIRILKK